MTTDINDIINPNNHVFLKNLDPETRAAAIAALPESKVLGWAARSFPGEDVRGLDFDEGIHKAGADFEVGERSLVTVPALREKQGEPVHSHKAIVNESTCAPIGVVGSGYTIVQNADVFGGLRDICEQGHASLTKVWVADGGAKVGAAALIGRYEISARIGAEKPETFAQYITCKSAHDGTGAIVFDRYSCQLICFNGATSQTRESRQYIRHTSNALDRVEVANHALVRLIEDAAEEHRLFEELGQSRLALREFVEFAEELLEDIRGEADTDRKVKRRVDDVTKLAELFEHGTGNHGQSKLDAYSAITEWLTPRREQYKDAAKFVNKFYQYDEGQAARTRSRALQLLTA